MKTWVAPILNFLPGFGLGYLLLGRRAAFERSVFAFVGIAAVAGSLARILLSGTTCGHFSCGVEAWAALSAAVTGSAALALVNFPTALHLLRESIMGLSQPAVRQHLRSDAARHPVILLPLSVLILFVIYLLLLFSINIAPEPARAPAPVPFRAQLPGSPPAAQEQAPTAVEIGVPVGSEFGWTRQFGSSEFDSANGISVDSTGVYVAGRTNGTLPDHTSGGGGDAFVRKYDADGNELWTRQFGTSASDSATGISVDSTGVYVAGVTEGTFPGQTQAGLWSRIVRVLMAPFGIFGSDETSPGRTDAFVRKYDADGHELWTRQFGTSSGDTAFGVSVDSTGVYVVGSFVRKYDADGNEIWTRQFGGAAVAAFGVSLDPTGVYVVGSVLGVGEAFVRKYDADGNELWTRQFGTSSAVGTGRASAISVDSTGVYVAGHGTLPGQTSAGRKDAFVRKYDTDGKELWSRQFGTSLEDSAYGISVDSTSVYVAGQSGGTLSDQTSAGNSDAFVVKFR